jgi:hypothetical protein
VSEPPEKPTDFGSPDFPEGIPEAPPEGGLFGMQPEPSFEQPLTPPAEAGPEGTASIAVPMEPSVPGMEEAAEESAPSAEIPEEQAEETEEEVPAGPTFWQRLGEQLDRYTVLLLLSLLAVTVAVVLLGLELSAYQWDIGAKAAR